MDELQVPKATKFITQNDIKGPCYAGICLPKNLLDLFPPRKYSRTYLLRDMRDAQQQQQQEPLLDDINVLTARQQMLNDSLNNDQLAGDESSVISSLSDISSSASKRLKCLPPKYTKSNCLYCARMCRAKNNSNNHNNGGTKQQQLPSACEIYSNTSAILIAAGLQASITLARKTNHIGSRSQQQKHQQQQQNKKQTLDISFNSPESILIDESIPDRVAANILYNVQRLANPVSAKQSKLALLELKQKHACAFQDICLYSEVCKTIGRCNYRMNARRFLQELFLDLNMEDAFYAEPLEILRKKLNNFSSKSKETSVVENVLKIPEVLNNAENADIVENTKLQATKVVLYKTALHKLQPLASVHESSCENLVQEQHAQQLLLKRKSLDVSNIDTVDCNGIRGQKPKVENENKKYSRGRFYTLELDLSCTKNKFPITHRTHEGATRPQFKRCWTTGDETIAATITTNNKNCTNNLIDSNCKLFNKVNANNSTYAVTKSLAASFKPIGSLYCEKRLLKTAKSEVFLTAANNDTIATSVAHVHK